MELDSYVAAWARKSLGGFLRWGASRSKLRFRLGFYRFTFVGFYCGSSCGVGHLSCHFLDSTNPLEEPQMHVPIFLMYQHRPSCTKLVLRLKVFFFRKLNDIRRLHRQS